MTASVRSLISNFPETATMSQPGKLVSVHAAAYAPTPLTYYQTSSFTADDTVEALTAQAAAAHEEALRQELVQPPLAQDTEAGENR